MSLILITILQIICPMHSTYCKLIVYENTICGDKNKSTTNLWTKQCRLLRHNVSSRFSYLYLRLGMWFKQVETQIITHYYMVVIFCVIQNCIPLRVEIVYLAYKVVAVNCICSKLWFRIQKIGINRYWYIHIISWILILLWIACMIFFCK